MSHPNGSQCLCHATFRGVRSTPGAATQQGVPLRRPEGHARHGMWSQARWLCRAAKRWAVRQGSK